MGMLINGLNAIRDLWDTLNDAGELGIGTNQETGEDTDLQTVISGSESTEITSTTTSQQLKKEVVFLSSSAGGQSVTEMIWKTQSPELAGSRIVFPTAMTWDATANLIIETRWFFKGRRD